MRQQLHADPPVVGSFWRQVRNSTVIAAADHGRRAAGGVAGRVRASPATRSGVASSSTALFTLGLLFPVAVAILPLFIMLRQTGLLSNPLGVALPQAAFGLPLSIVIMRPFFRAIPQEIQDAAAIDGCGPFRFYWSVMLPLSRPVLSTIAVITIVGSWNAFLLPLLVLTDPERAHAADRRQQHLGAVLDRLRARARLHDACR